MGDSMMAVKVFVVIVVGVCLLVITVLAPSVSSQSDNVSQKTTQALIQRDKFVLGLSKALKNEDYPAVLDFIRKLEGLGGELPPSIDYFRGEAYFHTSQHKKANEWLNKYIEATGRNGRYYKDALELILAAEEKAVQAENARAEKELKAAQEAYSTAVRALHRDLNIRYKRPEAFGASLTLYRVLREDSQCRLILRDRLTSRGPSKVGDGDVMDDEIFSGEIDWKAFADTSSEKLSWIPVISGKVTRRTCAYREFRKGKNRCHRYEKTRKPIKFIRYNQLPQDLKYDVSKTRMVVSALHAVHKFCSKQ